MVFCCLQPAFQPCLLPCSILHSRFHPHLTWGSPEADLKRVLAWIWLLEGRSHQGVLPECRSRVRCFLWAASGWSHQVLWSVICTPGFVSLWGVWVGGSCSTPSHVAMRRLPSPKGRLPAECADVGRGCVRGIPRGLGREQQHLQQSISEISLFPETTPSCHFSPLHLLALLRYNTY